MMHNFSALFAVLISAIMVHSFGGSEEKFIKKYAMMKIYESCFGDEVIKQIRREMKEASIKCAGLHPPPMLRPTTPPPHDEQTESDNSIFQQHPQSTFDQEKFQQTIFAYRPNTYQPQAFRPFAASPVGYYPGPINGFGNPGISASFAPGPVFYPSFQQPQFTPYGSFPIVGQSPYNTRMSTEMDIKSQLLALTAKMSGRVRNITCVMHELGYLDDNLEPNYQRISERIGNLPINEELRKDMQDGVTFCQQFSQCMPEVHGRSPLSRELIRPMFFFKCYKHKKLEACIMKDVREKYSGISEDEFDDVELRRSGKARDMDSGESDELALSIYDYLYASDSNIDLDSLL